MSSQFIKLVFSNIISMFSYKKVLASITIFIIINYITESIYDITNINEVIKFSFYGVINIIDLPIELLKWTLNIIIFLYIMLSYVNNQINKRSSMIIIRLCNKKMYINSLICSILILCGLYYTIAYSILFVLNIEYLSKVIDHGELLKIFILLIMYSFFISLVGVVLNFYINNEVTLMCTILLLCYISISIGTISNSADMFMIFNQGILVKHDLGYFTYMWSYVLLGIHNVLLYKFIKYKFIHTDV